MPSVVALATAALLSAGIAGLSPHTAHAAAPPPCSTASSPPPGTLCIKTTLAIPVAVGSGSPSSPPESCTVDGDLYEPYPKATTGTYPLILTTNGFGGTKADQAGAATALASSGYVVFSYSGLGFGNSADPQSAAARFPSTTRTSAARRPGGQAARRPNRSSTT